MFQYISCIIWIIFPYHRSSLFSSKSSNDWAFCFWQRGHTSHSDLFPSSYQALVGCRDPFLQRGLIVIQAQLPFTMGGDVIQHHLKKHRWSEKVQGSWAPWAGTFEVKMYHVKWNKWTLWPILFHGSPQATSFEGTSLKFAFLPIEIAHAHTNTHPSVDTLLVLCYKPQLLKKFSCGWWSSWCPKMDGFLSCAHCHCIFIFIYIQYL